MQVRFLEINERTLGKPPGASHGRSGAPWKLLARCEGSTADSCVLIAHLKEMGSANKEDGKSALSALSKLINVAATGQPIENFYDSKQSHLLHEFVYKQRNRVVWRIRKGDVRIAFYYAEDKIIFLADVFAKRKDKLTKGEKKQLEDEVKAYIDAEDDQQLVVISQQGE